MSMINVKHHDGISECYMPSELLPESVRIIIAEEAARDTPVEWVELSEVPFDEAMKAALMSCKTKGGYSNETK
ncbi:hypothetical protein F6A13_03550 [Acidithiobacillus sp. 'AMD consortium']|uniref:hypothetical protein n=1 Tax=Acidithiobacillus sp. 'AMD consortium' TaxID=2614801 RepID=UPI00124C14E6|nr:hypothetical protein [Acidithiobacillus sp. 'AMD consortium']QFG77811.1 hypothetical protein F6A13_03550 [Acidithiobacillus sp. 'AMD consortium']